MEKQGRIAMLKEITTTSSPVCGESVRFSIPSVAYASVKQVARDGIQIALAHNNVVDIATGKVSTGDLVYEVLEQLRRVAQIKGVKIVASSFQGEQQDLAGLVSALWLQEDIVPYAVREQDALAHASLEEQVGDVASHFDVDDIVYPQVGAYQEVDVAELVSLEDYRRVTSSEDFSRLQVLASAFVGKRLVFINATPRGGGVALMRHALIRLLRLFHVDAHWHVLMPRQEAFDITKTRFHNVLQAVADPRTELTLADKEVYNNWIRENAATLEKVFREADVVVIDDPQPAGLIPYIKEANPQAKIIYRSHIQIVGSLASQPGTPQYKTWSFLWNFIQHADYFVSHPLQMFIPNNVPAEKIFYVPATTDPLDGLNKPMTEEQLDYYMQIFNNQLVEIGQTPLDASRPYIVQIARFDPSKGIPDVLDAYWKLRMRLEEEGAILPQLVIAGNGSIDDPDGLPIYNHVMTTLQAEPYVPFANDVKVVRLPHRDQVLNTLLRRCAVALQLSLKEGFEVKVTEALLKGKPLIAYRTGGIPLQIEEGVNGYLVTVHDTTLVAQHLYNLFTDAELYQRMSQAAETLANREYLTLPNAICWLYLSLLLVNGDPQEGQYQWAKPLADTYVARIEDQAKEKVG